MQTATSISLNSTISGSITDAAREHFYKFTLSNSGCLNVTGSYYIYSEYTRIYDSKGNEVWSKTNYWNNTTQSYVQNEYIDLTSGTYYYYVGRWSGNGNYSFKLSFTSSNESFREPQGGNNNSIQMADAISLNTTYKGQIANNDDMDFYKFVLPASGCVNVTGTYQINWEYTRIYDSKGNEVWSDNNYWNYTTQTFVQNENIYLTSGTYYFYVGKLYGSTGNYTFKLNFTSSNESFGEPQGGNNNSIQTADSIVLNTVYKGQIANNDDMDFYKFILPTSGYVNMTGTYQIYCEYTRIYDSKANEVWGKNNYWNYTTQTFVQNENIYLTSGTYYYYVGKSSGNTGNYSFKLNFTSADESFQESQSRNNNSIGNADQISVGSVYIGQLAINDTVDFYKMTIPSYGTYTLSIRANDMENIDYTIYDSTGKELLDRSAYDNGNSGIIAYNMAYTISRGTYYLAFRKSYSYGNYMFCLSRGNSTSGLTGWVKISGKWYYLLSNGAKKTGWMKKGQSWYYFNTTGVMQTGWQKIGGTWYLFDSHGVMQTGWKKQSGKWYYLQKSGAMTKGWCKINKNWFYFNSNGVMQTGWLTLGKNRYYLNPNGTMVTGSKYISGRWYYFDKNGVLR